MHELQRLLDDFVAAHDDMPGVLMCVDAPGAGVHWIGGSGCTARGGDPLLGHETFRTASVTKTFVAAAILRLVDRGSFTLDAPIAPLLPDDVAARLAVTAPDAAAITLQQVLQHTSGVHDFGTDPAYRRAIGEDPHRVWAARDLLEIAFDHAPDGAPGAAFHYSDSGYVLLALVLERATGQPFAAALRATVGLDPLGLASTWLEGKEPPPAAAPARVHQYMGAVDTHSWDPSFDGYGGGGLVSSAQDLCSFLRSLVGGELLAPATTAAMQRCDVPTDLGEVGQFHGLGLFRSEVDGITRVGHEGFWGVWMYHFPDHEVTVAGAHTDFVFDMAAKRALLHGPLRVLGAIT